MKIDVYTHIMPEKYLAALKKKMPSAAEFREAQYLSNTNVDIRIKYMDRYPDVLQVLTLSLPPVEALFKPSNAADLSRRANDELAELVAKHPDRFIAGVACLPLNDIDAALNEIDRAVTKLKLRGIQLFTNINGEPLDLPKFRPLYEKMAYYDLPIWIHPWVDRSKEENVFIFDYEIALAMLKLVSSGTFQDYPGIKFIMHHCGGIVPLFDGRISWLCPEIHRNGQVIDTLAHLRKFYVDSAVSGSTSALMCAYDFYGIDQMLFAADIPLGPWPAGMTLKTIQSVERMPIPDNEKQQIFERNAIKLLKLAI